MRTRACVRACVQVVTPDPSQRALSEGVEVMAGAPVLLLHAATSTPLCLEACKVPTDYGVELELSARQATAANKKLAMEQLATVRRAQGTGAGGGCAGAGACG